MDEGRPKINHSKNTFRRQPNALQVESERTTMEKAVPNQNILRLSYTVAKKHGKQAMFAGFAGDVRTLLPGKAKQRKKLNHSYYLLSCL